MAKPEYSVKVTGIGVDVEDDRYSTVISFKVEPRPSRFPQLWTKGETTAIARKILKDPAYRDFHKNPGYVKIMEGTEFEAKPEMPTAKSPKDLTLWGYDKFYDQFYVYIQKQYYDWDKYGNAYPKEG